MATTPKKAVAKPSVKPSAPEVQHTEAAPPPVTVIVPAYHPWRGTPVAVRLVFIQMLEALTNLPTMQGHHGAGCRCRHCSMCDAALTAAMATIVIE